jgi:hypothetical protein
MLLPIGSFKVEFYEGSPQMKVTSRDNYTGNIVVDYAFECDVFDAKFVSVARGDETTVNVTNCHEVYTARADVYVTRSGSDVTILKSGQTIQGISDEEAVVPAFEMNPKWERTLKSDFPDEVIYAILLPHSCSQPVITGDHRKWCIPLVGQAVPDADHRRSLVSSTYFVFIRHV